MTSVSPWLHFSVSPSPPLLGVDVRSMRRTRRARGTLSTQFPAPFVASGSENPSMNRRNVYSNTPWETKVAYCRATRIGDTVVVSGTVAVDDSGATVGPGDVYAQTSYAIQKIDRALRELGASLRDVIRTRTFLTDITRFEEFARAHREAFAGIDPAATCVEVSRLVSLDLLVEIEMDAIVRP